MEQDFIKDLTSALELLQQHKTVQLGTHPILYQLHNLMCQRSGLPVEEFSQLAPAALGEIIRDTLVSEIESLKPDRPENANDAAWRHYIVLRDYLVLGKKWSDVADRLSVARARFYDYRKAAIGALATGLARLERECAERSTPPRDNLPYPPYARFVARYNEQGEDYVETIIEKLKFARAWFIASDGSPGVGKTTIAYETAVRCKNRQIFDVIIWTSAKQQILRTADTIPVATYVTEINTILDLIGTTAENRRILSVDSYNEKAEIALQILATQRCLLIVDNLESLDAEQQKKILTFLENLPRPSKAIITGRERQWIGLYTVTVMGMRQDEALRFMQEEAERRTVPPLSKGDAIVVHKATHGNPLAMQQVIGLIQSLGFSLKEALAFDEIQSHDQMLDFMYAEAYEKLTAVERKILHVLPLFTDLAESDALLAASGVHRVQLSLGLQHLYRSFLIQRVGETRYDLLPFARQFLGSRQRRGYQLHDNLPLIDFLTDAHRRLVAHYLEYLREMNLDEQLRYLKYERRNILGLLEWCYINEEWQSVVDLVDEMSRPLGTLRYLEVEIFWGQRAMEACERLDAHAKREWFKLYCVAWPHIHLDERKRAKARQMIEESVQVAQQHGYVQLEALALRNLGRVIIRDGDYVTALQLLRDSLNLWDRNGDLGQGWIAHTLSAIGEAEYHLGDYESARDSLVHAWRLRRQDGDTDGIIAATSDIALVLLAMGEDQRALFWSDRGLNRAEQIAKPARAYAYAHQRRAELEELRGNSVAARKHSHEAIQTYEALGMSHWVKSIKAWLAEHVEDPTTLGC
ncbi:MAG: NB-ARC domain-containing protein [Caldilineaceae bacterium]